jgi:small basic protein
LGIIAGAFLPLNIPPEYTQYTAVAILIILDSIISAICSQIKKEFHIGEFVSGMIAYILLGTFLVYLGNKLNIDLYLGIVVVFMFRIMQNIGIVRGFYFQKFFKAGKDKGANIEY